MKHKFEIIMNDEITQFHTIVFFRSESILLQLIQVKKLSYALSLQFSGSWQF